MSYAFSSELSVFYFQLLGLYLPFSIKLNNSLKLFKLIFLQICLYYVE